MQYEYTCKVCNLQKSVERSIFDDEERPLCCGEIMGRVFTAAPVKFNASGFYSTGG